MAEYIDGLSTPLMCTYFFKCQADMESAMEQEVLENEEPKSAAAVVADILTKECPSSRFLQNVGLQSTSKKKFNMLICWAWPMLLAQK